MVTKILRPNGQGTLNQLSYYPTAPKYELIDDTTPDEDATYIYTVKATETTPPQPGYETDNYTIENTLPQNIAISKITLYCRIRNTYDSNTGQIRIHTGDGSTYSLTCTFDTNWTTFSKEWSINDGTGLPWTYDEITDLEIGIRIEPTLDESFNVCDTRCTQIYLEVEYILLPQEIIEGESKITTIIDGDSGVTITDTGSSEVTQLIDGESRVKTLIDDESLITLLIEGESEV